MLKFNITTIPTAHVIKRSELPKQQRLPQGHGRHGKPHSPALTDVSLFLHPPQKEVWGQDARTPHACCPTDTPHPAPGLLSRAGKSLQLDLLTSA